MKPFSLTTVLKYRRQVENSAALLLSQAQVKLVTAQQKLENVDNEINAIIVDAKAQQSSGINIEDLLRYEHRISWLKTRRKELSKEYEAALEAVNKKRLDAIEKSKNKKILERLKKKQDSQWRTHQNRNENKQLDEVAVFSHKRKLRENS